MSDVDIRIRDDNTLDYEDRNMGLVNSNQYSQYNPYRATQYGYAESDMFKTEQTVTDIDLEKRKWSNRRRMAWTSLISMLVLTVALLALPIPESRLKILAEPLTWFFLSMTSIIGAYMGFTTWASRK